MADEVSPGGSEIFRHEPRQRELEPSVGDGELIEAIDRHLETFLGEGDRSVFHEVLSDRVHVDVHMVPPAREREWTTLVTSGMAERPMTMPEGLEGQAHAELVLALPASWPLRDEAFEDERNYWPIRLLKGLARLPHEFETFLSHGHTIPNGDPPEPYADGTALCGALICPPILTPEAFDRLELADGRVVHFYGVFPLHGNEIEFKLQKGANALWERFAEAGMTELVDPGRESVTGRRRRLFRRG